MSANSALRKIPAINTLLERAGAATLSERYSRDETISAVQAIVAHHRDQLANGRESTIDFSSPVFFSEVEQLIKERRQVNLRRVVNATGIVLHTNLGRAPLAPEAVNAICAVASGYSTLELDIATGNRGSRNSIVEDLLCEVTGAEAAFVVNNCAAAVVLTLAALAEGRDVIVSRGELIEIGGSFRMPDIIRQSGARLVEAGATNKTKLGDYEAAICDDTALLLKSHTSNFKIVGFTAAPTRRELAELAHARGVLLIEDMGSGVLSDRTGSIEHDEPNVADAIEAGVDAVTFSGDKLLGGPQAGVICGTAAVVDRLKKHPLARAVRIDKLCLAALEATLRLYAQGLRERAIPVLKMLNRDATLIKDSARNLSSRLSALPNVNCKIVETTSFAGGGSLPGEALSSFAVAVEHARHSPDDCLERLRRRETPVIGRIHQGRLILDCRTLLDGDEAVIANAFANLA